MTPEEYAEQIGAELRRAYNGKSQTDVQAVISKADATIANSPTLTDADKREFWESVRNEFYDGQLLVEKQDNSALHVLMRSIISALDARS